MSTAQHDDKMTCPVCLQITSRIKMEDWHEYTLFKCERCDVVFSDPFIAGDATWYEESGIYQLAKYYKKLYWHHEQFLLEPPPGRKLLDIGCNNGVFLHHAEKIGYEVTGMDFNEFSLEAGRQAFGLDRLYCSSIKEFIANFPDETFDVITVFEVLEHLDNPNDFLKDVERLLHPSGYIVISVPNRDMMINPLGESDYPPHHLTKWSGRALENILRSHGYTIISHKMKKITAEDFARWFDYNVVRKFDHIVRSKIKRRTAKAMESNWRSGNIDKLPFSYRLRQLELHLLIGLFWPVSAFFRLIRSQGFGQYVLAKRS